MSGRRAPPIKKFERHEEAAGSEGAIATLEGDQVMDEATPSLSTPAVATAAAVNALAANDAAPCDGCAPVRFTPSDIARREITHWNGIDAETIELVRREPYEYQLKSSCHMLVMAEHAERDDGETQVEGLPTSTLRKFSGMLSFVPSGHRLSGWQKPRVLTRVTYFYIDPDGPLLDPALRFAETEFKPRLFFHDPELWSIASKLKAQADDATPGQQQYAEALGILLVHELLRLNSDGDVDAGAGKEIDYVRGGLAAWQKTRVTDYVEEHLAETVMLSQLAEVARLSPFHFSRAFKQSFGLPPLRYVTGRRIERAKSLLAGEVSITQVGLALGFAETSSFTAAFRRHTGVTPTAFRRGL
jgi:AraC family transcriptional regulator